MRRSPTGPGSEVFFLGSEGDFEGRPEGFVDSWLNTNAVIQLVPLDGAICPDAGQAKVHAGFQASYLRIRRDFHSALAANGDGPADGLADDAGPGALAGLGRVVLVGYSLGGALATLALTDLAAHGTADVELLTFGAPRVGNASFRELGGTTCLTLLV